MFYRWILTRKKPHLTSSAAVSKSNLNWRTENLFVQFQHSAATIPFGPQGCRHWWVEPASWPRCGRWWSSGPSSRQSCPQTCPRQRQQRTSPSETQQRCSFNKMNELKCHRFTLHINVPVFKPSYGSLALKLICFLARLIEKNPALIVSQSMTTKWTGLTWTVGVVGCLIQTGDVFLEVSTWQSEQKPYRELLFCEIVCAKKKEKLAHDDRSCKQNHFLKLARSLREAQSCCFQTNCFARIRNEQHNHLSHKQAFSLSHWN